ncbi:major facilitator superfamily domain-containing protein [Pisolithus tinctorius]|nr:major facilitator superfamily domain-containing protein [Pisolithus tinctorius]
MHDLTTVRTNSTAATTHVVPPKILKALPDEPNKDADPFMVSFSESDPDNPKNWSSVKRWYLTGIAGLLVLNATFASSAPSALVPTLMDEFGISREVGNLMVSLFVAGYCVGPLIWGPLSEQYGRRPVFILTFFVYMCFQIGCALSKNIASLLVFRFIGGTFASCPLANSGALIGDIWDAKRLGIASAIFAVAPFAGPGIGPVVSGYLVQSEVSWRWLFWILTVFAGVCLLLIVFTVPETFQPVILVKKAQKVRRQTSNERYYASFETRKLSFAQQMENILARPFKILFHEPMLIAITLYMSFVYGCIYLLFEAYPIVFTEGHHMGAGPSGLTFLPLPIGGVIATLVYIAFFNPRYERKIKEFAPKPVPPEYRLEMAMLAGPFFAISFFWFAWTSFPSVSLWVPLASGLLLGCGVCWIFLSLLNYIIDAYMVVAASALAANTVIRSIFGAVFPLFANQMYDRLGAQWASSLLGFVALAMAPIPFALSRYGPALRVRSKYAPTDQSISRASSPV